MEEEINLRLRIVRAIKADNVVVLVLNPNSPEEAHGLFALPRLYVNDEATQFSQEFATDKSELVVLFLKISVEQDHLRKAHRQIMQRVDSRKFAQHAMTKPRLAYKRHIFRAIRHIQAAEKILIPDRHGMLIGIILQVLQIGLNQRMHVTHLRHEVMLSLYHAIHNVVQGCGRRRSII